ncbi:MAG TPA: NAD(P)H-hydrate dehydratase [bacterium]|nr:NAD(P)H-hydrate dehydratase [bacterium]HPN42766.1 NAD(P)H-hydrate dehydratase [bacterium]
MQPVVTAKQMADLDKSCIEHMHIPGLLLMENAGLGVVRQVKKMLHGVKGKYIHIYCGPGNNGGDGFVIARHLFNMMAIVHVHILASREKISSDALINLQILESIGVPLFWGQLPDSERIPDLIIDALLGTGVKGALKGIIATCVDHINSYSCPVIAVDIPTGVNADTGEVAGLAVQADVTVTMALPKKGLLFSPGREYAGKLIVTDISMPFMAIDKSNPQVWLIERTDVRKMLPIRAADAHKNKCGTVAVVAGSKGFTGAACLTSLAVLRTGAGLCYLAVPKSLNSIVESKLTEVISWVVEDDDKGYLFADNNGELVKKIQQQSAVVIGPGLGQQPQTGELVHALLRGIEKPCVLDADGLNLCAGQTRLFREYRGDLILTPHPGEFSRLTGLPAPEIVKNRLEVVRQYAQEWQVTIILKGGPTIIGCRNGQVYINSTGNAGMATAGSGDVLSGMIAALLAQGVPAEKAAIAGVYLHGLAGDIAKKNYGEMGLVAGDIVNAIPKALLTCARV